MDKSDFKTNLSQLKLLLWKNYKLQKRAIIGTFLELLLPAFFAIILLPIRSIVKSDDILNDTRYDTFQINSLPIDLLPESAQSWSLSYTPNNVSLVDKIMEKFDTELGLNLNSFRTEDEMIGFIMNETNFGNCLGGITFLNYSEQDLAYKIRLSYSPRNAPKSPGLIQMDQDWKTNLLYTLFPVLGPREKEKKDGGDPGYYREGFLSLQSLIDNTYIAEVFKNITIPDIDLSLERFPYPPYNNDAFVIVIQALFPFIIMLSFVFTVILTAKAIVYEKETGIKEAMKLMGMKMWIYWLSWYIKTFILVTPAVIFMCVSFKVKIHLTAGNREYASIINQTDPSILVLFFLLYVSSTITFTFFLTTLFKKANSAAAGAGIIYFFSYLPYIFISIRYEKMSLTEKLLAAFVSNLGMSEAMQLIGMFEGKGVGINWSNINEGISVDDNFTFLQVAIILFFNNFIHLFLTYYCEQVFPGDHGIAKPWYFPIYCLFPKLDEAYLLDKVDDKHENSIDYKNEVFIENESNYSAKSIGIKIRNLSKAFKQFNKVKYAVQNLSLNIYENHITVLLGHNGAGKSTTISMITGSFAPTKGSIHVNDYNVVNDTKKARAQLGYCPQHNLLFDDLTVYEHLVFYSKLKNNFSNFEINEMLLALNLSDKVDALSKTLSGGMKRKLCVAIAFIGGSEIVILDEPTSGMDPQARHSTWSLLQKFKKERKCSILLTTHFMDEADFLGDRIAIMSRGKLCCCGSPLYLKSKYGSGYNLNITRKQNENMVVSPTMAIMNTDNDYSEHQITQLIQKHIKDAKLNTSINSELSYVLPKEDCDKFPELFTDLETSKDSLNIINIGVSVTTVEEVFLKIGELENVDELNESNMHHPPVYNHQSSSICESTVNFHDHEDEENDDDDDTLGLWVGSSDVDRVDSYPTFRNADCLQIISLVFLYLFKKLRFYAFQFRALIMKRIINSLRNKILVVSQVIVPIACLLIILIYLKYAPIKAQDSPELLIDLTRYRNNYVPYTINDEINSQFLKDLEKSYQKVINNYKANSNAFNLVDNVTVNLCTDAKSRSTIDDYLVCIGRLSVNYITDNYLTASEFVYDNTSNILNIIGHFNNQPFHVPPLTVNLLSNTLLNLFDSSKNGKITVINHPLPRNLKDIIKDAQSRDPVGFNIASNITFGFSFLIASFALFLIKERVSGAKHIQYLSGANTFIFWLSALVWDYFNYLIPTILSLLAIKAFGINAFIDGGRVKYTGALLILYGFAHIPQTYILSYMFKVPSTGFASIVAWNLLSSQATLTAWGILLLPQLDLTNVADLLQWIFMIIFPNFALGSGLNDLYTNYESNEFCKTYVEYCDMGIPNPCCIGKKNLGPNPCGGPDDCVKWTTNYMDWERPGLLRFFIFMPLQFFVQFGLIYMYETGFIRKLTYFIKRLLKGGEVSHIQNDVQIEIETLYGDFPKDADVIAEENRINGLLANNEPTSDLLVIDNLKKYYSTFMAVKGMSLGIKQSECFGLLGVNGAGKTSTFKMLTGDETITHGSAYLNKLDIKNNLKEFQKQIGYCPQFDPLIEQMTCMETLIMYSRLRSIREQLIMPTCESLIKLLDLSDHKNKMCYTLSGGNKRKLSVAISLIGSPVIVFLDEPTSGMDPRTRRFLWDALNKIRNKGKSLILTTHSMDETEALCTRIGIMVNGELKCLGNLQDLKAKYGDGYTLMVKLMLNDQMNNEEKIKDFIQFILSQFANSYLKENREGFINIQINDSSIKMLANIFSIIEKVKDKYSIEYYVVTQTKLEQIFLNFASKQIDPESRFIHKSGFKLKCC